MHATGQADPLPLQTAVAGVSFSLGASVGLVDGTAAERVFYYAYGKKIKISELTWDLKDIVMAGVHGSVGVGRRFRLNLGFWSALTAGNGMMVDLDWDPNTTFLKPSEQNWMSQSRHPDTSLDKGTVVDLNLSVLALQAGPFSLSGLVGYKNEVWNWSARGGSGVYSWSGFRTDAWVFPDGEEVIRYEQRYSIPYLGVGANWRKPAFRVEAHLLISPLVSAGDTDDHIVRGVHYEGDFSGGTYVGLGLNATWAFAANWSATCGVEYQSISEITGDVTISGDEGSGFYPGGGGVAMSATLVTLGAGYRF